VSPAASTASQNTNPFFRRTGSSNEQARSPDVSNGFVFWLAVEAAGLTTSGTLAAGVADSSEYCGV
jgi:hypothetical protein